MSDRKWVKQGPNSKLMLMGAVFSTAAIVAACGGSSSSNSDDVTATEVIENYALMAQAAYDDSLATAQELKVAVDAFIAEPTEDNLNAAKAAYKATRIPYQQSEIMRWDTEITINSGLQDDGVGPASVDEWEGQVNAWPLDENHIDSIIEGTDEINAQLLIDQNGANDEEANVTTGVHAIEYMLWGTDENGTGPGAGERPVTDYANDGTCADCERRAQYLSAATDLLVADLTEMAAEWSDEAATTSGSLAYNFINSPQALDYILGSMRLMATDELASARMNSGLELRDTEEEHDCFSDLSHVAIYYNFQGVKNAFYGEYSHVNSVSGASFGDLVRQADQATYDEMDAAFQSIEEKMAQILDAGERTENTIRFDQIIGQADTDAERQIANSAVNELVALDANFNTLRELLSLTDINTGGGGDGD